MAAGLPAERLAEREKLERAMVRRRTGASFSR
jgi:hypothetical protein